MSDRVEIPPMPEFPPDYRDDYVKAQLSRAVYYNREHLIADSRPKEIPEGAVLPPGWSLLGDDRANPLNFRDKSDTSGFFAAAFEDEHGRIVIAFRGTDDLGTDWSLGLDGKPVGPNPVLAADSDLAKELGVPAKTDKTGRQLADAQEWVLHKAGNPDWNDQFTQALDYVAEIRRQYPGRRIEVTGHSLGGALAELTSYTYGLDGRAFDPPGAKNLLDSEGYRKYRERNGIERNDAALALGLPMHEPDFVNYLVRQPGRAQVRAAHLRRQDPTDLRARRSSRRRGACRLRRRQDRGQGVRCNRSAAARAGGDVRSEAGIDGAARRARAAGWRVGVQGDGGIGRDEPARHGPHCRRVQAGGGNRQAAHVRSGGAAVLGTGSALCADSSCRPSPGACRT